MRAIIAISLLLFVISGCIKANQALSPTAVSGAEPTESEKALMEMWDEIEKRIAKSGTLYEDPKLHTYLHDTLDQLTKTSSSARIYVVPDPRMNAFVFPNGAIYLNTGMLARLQNEAQLATVLAHEYVHFSNRHTMNRLHRSETVRGITNFLNLFTGGVAIQGTRYLTRFLNSKYSQDMENEADMLGIQLVSKAGYDAEQGKKLFNILKTYYEEEGVQEHTQFSTHPLTKDRIKSYSSYLKNLGTQSSPGILRAREYREITADSLLRDAEVNLTFKLFKQARTDIDAYIQIQPNNSRGYFLRGEILRQRGNDISKLEKAVHEYQKAVRLNPSFSKAYRELGLTLKTLRQPTEAAEALSQYLSLKPQAIDAVIIKKYVEDLKQN